MRWAPTLVPALAGPAMPVRPRPSPPERSRFGGFVLGFDSTNWTPAPSEPEPPVRRMSDRDERVALTLMVVVLLMLLLMPLSMGMLVDVVRYLRR